MSKKGKLKMLGRVKLARQRIRDRAAGEYAVAEAAELVAEERRDVAEAEIDEVKDAAMSQLPVARDVRVLWNLERERVVAEALLVDAVKGVQVARDEAEKQRLILARRARELKTAEKVIDQTKAGLRRAENKAEQRTNDDLASRGRRDD